MARRRVNRGKQTRPPRHTVLLALAAINLSLLCLIGCGALVAGGSAGTVYAYNVLTRELPNPNDLAIQPLAQVTQLYDRTGTQLLYEFYEERRMAVPLADVSPTLLQATLAAEDVNFYQHKGFDLKGLIRAAWANYRNKGIVEGASTITQQLVKRTLVGDERSYIRKLKELILAVQVESVYPKDQIFEMYLNQVYYGNQAYGVEAASLAYFGKHAGELNLAEASLLAGLVQLPSTYDPVSNPGAALQRQGQVLDVMVRHRMATPEQAAQAADEAKGFSFQPPETSITVPHFAFYAKEQLSRLVGSETVREGLKVITTIDLGLQARAQDIVRRRVDEIRWQHVNNGALVALNPQTGEILAMVGSYDYYDKSIDGQVNVATAPRQPGSSFKPFTYATAFATRRWAPASQIADEPISRTDQGSPFGFYRPLNYDGGWHGVVTLRSALANSFNIPAVLMQDAVGTREVIRTARKLGLTTELPEVPSLTLGAGSVRLLEMTAAYGVFGNLGQRVDTTPFLKVETQDGRVLYELKEPYRDREIWPQVAYLITDILADRMARRSMFGNVLDLAGNRTAAVKTGTTNDYKDSWTIGYTPSLVVGVWVGNTDNSSMLQVAGSLGAGYIWKDFMDQTLAETPDEPFPIPPDVVWAPICPERKEVEVFMSGPFPSCPQPYRAPPEWRAGLGPLRPLPGPPARPTG